MSSTNGTTTSNMPDSNPAAAPSSKGKGKAIETAPPQQDMSMDEDDDSSDEETGAEDDVRTTPPSLPSHILARQPSLNRTPNLPKLTINLPE